MPHEINNPNIQGAIGIVDKNTVDDSLPTGTVAPGAQCASFLNNSDSVTVLVGVSGKLTRLVPGAARNYGSVNGVAGQIKQVLEWDATGGDLAITVQY